MYLTPNWVLSAEGNTAIVSLGRHKGLLFLEEADTAIGLFRDRWFYLREGDATLARLREWVYLRDGDTWMLRLPFRFLLMGQGGKVRLTRRRAA